MDIYPTFNGNFYDVMDAISTNWSVTGGTTSYKWVQGTLNGSGVAKCTNCSTESQLVQKTAMSKKRHDGHAGLQVLRQGCSRASISRSTCSRARLDHGRHVLRHHHCRDEQEHQHHVVRQHGDEAALPGRR